MCGIAGGYWEEPARGLDLRFGNTLEKLSSRGPDDRGFNIFSGDDGVIGLGHTRLSILDLSPAGHQPMMSLDNRYVIVFNGEIYNYRELGKELEVLGHNFVSDTDTEVLLAAWIEWGSACLTRLEGMFAFVVYDKHQQSLTCVRDAFGIKPIFYTHDNTKFVFASEQAALIFLLNESPKVSWQSSYDYLVHGVYDHQENSFIAGVKHLLPGHLLELSLNSTLDAHIQCWWKPEISQNSTLNFSQSVEAVREQFLSNIRLHLRSDVPLGAALSGGVDSSAIVCAMRYVEPDIPINTFSYIARGSVLSEEKWVDKINSFTSANSFKVTVSGAGLAKDIDEMIQVQGEPFGSTSIYAQYRVFKLAREHGVTVMLDGQGADELLAGYSGYPGQRILSLLEQGKFVTAQQFASQWSRWPGREYKLAWMELGRIMLPDNIYRKARKILGRNFTPEWLNNGVLFDAGIQFSEPRMTLDKAAKGRRVIERLANALQAHGLPALLRHADRNSMRFSVESRVPFLTLPMANLLLSLPEHYLISDNGETKNVFRAAMRGIVPDDVLDRKDKIGFATPEREWLIGMAPVAREWLQASQYVPFINRDALLKKFDAIIAGKAPFSWQVWRWVNFVRWYETSGMGA